MEETADYADLADTGVLRNLPAGPDVERAFGENDDAEIEEDDES